MLIALTEDLSLYAPGASAASFCTRPDHEDGPAELYAIVQHTNQLAGGAASRPPWLRSAELYSLAHLQILELLVLCRPVWAPFDLL